MVKKLLKDSIKCKMESRQFQFKKELMIDIQLKQLK